MAENDAIPTALDQRSEVIAKDGDLTLIIGTGESQTTVQVYSQCLKSASKVFEVMLTPPWKEGQDLLDGKDAKVMLPEDDPEVMLEICRIIHHKRMSGGNTPSPTQLLQMIILADKYDLCNVLEPHISLRLDTIKPETTEERMYCYAALCRIGYRAQKCPWLFDLIGRQTEPFGDLMDGVLMNTGLKFRDISRLEKSRARLQLRLTEYFVNPHCVDDCTASESDLLKSRIDQLKGTYSGPRLMRFPAEKVMMDLKDLYKYSDINWEPRNPPKIVEKHFTPNQMPKFTQCECGVRLFRGLDGLYTSTISEILAGMPT